MTMINPAGASYSHNSNDNSDDLLFVKNLDFNNNSIFDVEEQKSYLLEGVFENLKTTIGEEAYNNYLSRFFSSLKDISIKTEVEVMSAGLTIIKFMNELNDGLIQLAKKSIDNLKKNELPEKGDGFWLKNPEKYTEHLTYITNQLEGLGLKTETLSEEQVTEVLVTLFTKTDFDRYNPETSMMRDSKYCNVDENGNLVETHFLDYAVNFFKEYLQKAQ